MFKGFCFTVSLLLTSFFAGLLPAESAGAEAAQKSILVTGTSTGIGRNLTETLAAAGHHVYASVRSDEDFAALDALDNVTAVRMDVTRPDDIAAVRALIEARGTGLHGLVNNAGIGDGGAVIDTPIEQQTLVYQVNVEGVYRVTQAFAPLVIESGGRIVTTGSIAGTLAWAGGSAYSGSKHWIEAFTDALAEEMAPQGVSVSVVEPGNYQSHIRRSAVLRGFERVRAAGGEITPDMQAMYEATTARELSYKTPEEVSAAFMHALFHEQPLRRYVVVPNQDEQALVIGRKLQQLLELNQWGPHRYSRDELVAMLDQLLTETSE